MASIGHDAWAIAHAKCSVWVKNKKCQKGENNDCLTSLKMLSAKNRPQKHLILEKREQFENGQNRPRCMQNAQFGSKIKNAKKNAKNDCLTSLKMLCAKKPIQETLNIRNMKTV